MNLLKGLIGGTEGKPDENITIKYRATIITRDVQLSFKHLKGAKSFPPFPDAQQ